MQDQKQDHTSDEYAKTDELPFTPEELAEIARKAAARQRPVRRIVKRAGITKNKGQKLAKAKRKQAKASRRINRG